MRLHPIGTPPVRGFFYLGRSYPGCSGNLRRQQLGQRGPDGGGSLGCGLRPQRRQPRQRPRTTEEGGRRQPAPNGRESSSGSLRHTTEGAPVVAWGQCLSGRTPVGWWLAAGMRRRWWQWTGGATKGVVSDGARARGGGGRRGLRHGRLDQFHAHMRGKNAPPNQT